MADTQTTTLTQSFTKVFDATTNLAESYTIQNNSTVPITFLKKSTTPADTERGLYLYKGEDGSVLDISDDVYFRATNSNGATLTFDLRS